MRILIITQAYPKVGNESPFAFVHSRVKIYRKFNNKVVVFVPSFTDSHYEFEGISVFKGLYSKLSGLLQTFGPEVIAVHGPTLSMTRQLLNVLKGRKFLIWIHGGEVLPKTLHHYLPPWSIIPKIKESLVSPVKLLFLRRFIRKSCGVVFCSEWLKNLAKTYTLQSFNAYVIPNPIDTSLFHPTSIGEHKRGEGVAVRNFGWKYGLDIAIKAFGKTKRGHLTILGTGNLTPYFQRLIEQHKARVTIVNRRIKHHLMPKFLSQFGYFVSPSRTEGQGVAMCEAMACGLPAIATRVGGIPEFVIHHLTGLLVPPENPIALKEAVAELLSNPSLYEAYSQNAVEFVQKRLSHSVIYEKDMAVLRGKT